MTVAELIKELKKYPNHQIEIYNPWIEEWDTLEIDDVAAINGIVRLG